MLFLTLRKSGLRRYTHRHSMVLQLGGWQLDETGQEDSSPDAHRNGSRVHGSRFTCTPRRQRELLVLSPKLNHNEILLLPLPLRAVSCVCRCSADQDSCAAREISGWLAATRPDEIHHRVPEGRHVARLCQSAGSRSGTAVFVLRFLGQSSELQGNSGLPAGQVSVKREGLAFRRLPHIQCWRMLLTPTERSASCLSALLRSAVALAQQGTAILGSSDRLSEFVATVQAPCSHAKALSRWQ